MTSFTGTFDGNGCTATGNLYLDDKGVATSLGLFGDMKGVLTNLTQSGDVTITKTFASGQAGTFTGYGSLSKCTHIGKVTATGTGIPMIGGLSGFGYTFDECKQIGDVTVSVNNATGAIVAGGIVGEIGPAYTGPHRLSIENSTLSVTTTPAVTVYLGTFVGSFRYGTSVTLYNCSTIGSNVVLKKNGATVTTLKSGNPTSDWTTACPSGH